MLNVKVKRTKANYPVWLYYQFNDNLVQKKKLVTQMTQARYRLLSKMFYHEGAVLKC